MLPVAVLELVPVLVSVLIVAPSSDTLPLAPPLRVTLPPLVRIAAPSFRVIEPLLPAVNEVFRLPPPVLTMPAFCVTTMSPAATMLREALLPDVLMVPLTVTVPLWPPVAPVRMVTLAPLLSASCSELVEMTAFSLVATIPSLVISTPVETAFGSSVMVTSNGSSIQAPALPFTAPTYT